MATAIFQGPAVLPILPVKMPSTPPSGPDRFALGVNDPSPCSAVKRSTAMSSNRSASRPSSNGRQSISRGWVGRRSDLAARPGLCERRRLPLFFVAERSCAALLCRPTGELDEFFLGRLVVGARFPRLATTTSPSSRRRHPLQRTSVGGVRNHSSRRRSRVAPGARSTFPRRRASPLQPREFRH
jgi:hypothetical protein